MNIILSLPCRDVGDSMAENLEDKVNGRRILYQEWEESERGWGVRPDGYSLHKDEASRKGYIEKYWNGMPDEVPDEYSRPCGEPRWIEVDAKTYTAVKRKGSVREYR